MQTSGRKAGSLKLRRSDGWAIFRNIAHYTSCVGRVKRANKIEIKSEFRSCVKVNVAVLGFPP